MFQKGWQTLTRFCVLRMFLRFVDPRKASGVPDNRSGTDEIGTMVEPSLHAKRIQCPPRANFFILLLNHVLITYIVVIVSFVHPFENPDNCSSFARPYSFLERWKMSQLFHENNLCSQAQSKGRDQKWS